MTLSKMQTLLFAAALLCIFLTILSCNNNVSITTEETPQKRIIASCDNGLLKKSNCVDTDDGTTDEVETEEPTPTPTVTPTATATPTATPTPAPPQFIEVGVSEDHSCGLTTAGKIYCWGSNGWANLGGGASITDDQESPIPIDTSTMTGEKSFIKLSIGRRHTCALTAEGIVWCWGRDANGQLGNGAGVTGNQDIPTAVDTSAMTGAKSFVDISSGYDTTCGLTAEGKAWCWGALPAGDQTAPSLVDTSGMSGEKAFIKTAINRFHICALTAEGKAWCWGDDTYGRLGNGAVTGTQATPSAVDISGMSGDKNFIDIASGLNHTCTLTNEGKAWCWGGDSSGQLGNGTGITADQTAPSAVDISSMTGSTRFTSISASTGISCALTVESKAWCWGHENFSELGNGATTGAQAAPVPLDTSVMTGEIAIKKIAPAFSSKHGCALTSEGKIWCWGEDGEGQLGNGSSITATQASPSPLDTTPLTTEKSFAKLVSGHTHVCGITGAGKMWCWGDNDSIFQFGSTNDLPSPTLFDVSGMTGDKIFAEIAPGPWNTCAIATDGRLWCWYNGSAPALADTSTIASEKTFVKASLGMSAYCGIATDGKAWCWGDDTYGQLGNGATTGTQTAASAVDTSTMTGSTIFFDIAVGQNHTCGIDSNGKTWCWGQDSSGQLGNGAGVTGNQVSPSAVDVSGMTGDKAFVQISANNKHTCALTAEGKVWCWGSDWDGALGNGATAGNQVVPVALDISTMTGDKSIKKVTYGYDHACVLTSQGKIWCWGADDNYQLGNGAATTTTQVSPSAVDTSAITGGVTFQDVTAGHRHTCALTVQGKAYCWGNEGDGQLGNGGSVNGFQASPGPVDDSGI